MLRFNSQVFSDCYDVYTSSRARNIDVCVALFDRIERMSPRRDDFDHTVATRPKSLSFGKSVSWLIWLPWNVNKYIKQIFNMHKWEQVGDTVLFLSSASSRLPIPNGSTARNHFAKLLRPIGVSKQEYCADPRLEGLLLLCDPMVHSKYWNSVKDGERELAVLDLGFVVFYSLVAILFSPIEIGKKLKGIKSASQCSLAEAIVAFGVLHISHRFKEYDSILLTSNSNLTEFFRWIHLQDDHCNSVLEVLHGIIAKPTEEYLAALGDMFTVGRHQIISQVPELPVLNGTNLHRAISNVAINPAWNQDNVVVPREAVSASEAVDEQLSEKRYIIEPTDSPRVAIFGGASVDNGWFYSSAAFSLELKIARQIQASMQDVVILYAPHPANVVELGWLKDELDKYHVHLLNSTIEGYLSCDGSVSLISSCLFETNWLGIPTLSPLVDEDGFYPKEYLDTLFHPRESSMDSLNEAVVAFCAKVELNCKHRSMNEGKKRLQLMFD